MRKYIEEAFDKIYFKVAAWIQHLILMLPNLFLALLVIVAFYVCASLIKKVLDKPLKRVSHNNAIIDVVLNLVFAIIVAIGTFIALGILKLDKAVTSLLAGAGIIGLALGFAFQDIAANFVSGILLILRRPAKLHDIIESNGYMGVVYNINLRSTIIRTFDGQYVHIPNKDIFSKPIVNYSTEGKRRIDLTCGISYGENLRKVRQVSLDAIKSIDYLYPGEDVTLFFNEFSDSSITFTVRYWVQFRRQIDYWNAMSDGIIMLKEAFDKNDITIPFPIRTLDFGIKGGEKLGEHLGELNLNGRDKE